MSAPLPYGVRTRMAGTRACSDAEEDIGGEAHAIPHGHRHMQILHDGLVRGNGRTRAASQN